MQPLVRRFTLGELWVKPQKVGFLFEFTLNFTLDSGIQKMHGSFDGAELRRRVRFLHDSIACFKNSTGQRVTSGAFFCSITDTTGAYPDMINFENNCAYNLKLYQKPQNNLLTLDPRNGKKDDCLDSQLDYNMIHFMANSCRNE